MRTVNFIIPGLYEHYKLNILFCTMLKAHPEYFYDNVNVSAIFGNFQFSTWDGGRTFIDYYYANKELVERLVYIYNQELNIPMRLVFTSHTITERDLYDRYNNMILTLCHNEMNEIVVASPLLEDYIRTNYPKYSFISSTTKCLNKDELLKEIDSNKYKMVCLNYNLNKHKGLLEEVTKEQKEKMEFLINAICPSGCPNRKNHYYLNSLFSQSYGKMYSMKSCDIKGTSLNYQDRTRHINNLQPDDVFEYFNNGFNNFKIEGRTFTDIEMILHLVKYMVKPEYHSTMILGLFSMLENFDVYDYSYDVYKNYYVV